MVITKREDVTKQALKKTPSSGKSLISTHSIGGWEGKEGGVGVGCYLSLSGSGRLLTFSAFRRGAYSRLGAYSNKYGHLFF